MITTRLVVTVLLGGLAGLGYHRFIGCRSGACAIWQSPYLSTLYGAAVGWLLAGARN